MSIWELNHLIGLLDSCVMNKEKLIKVMKTNCIASYSSNALILHYGIVYDSVLFYCLFRVTKPETIISMDILLYCLE